jgi:hypothetical protein
MSNTETQPKDDEQENKDDVVLSQIGEDPGLSADTIEQDSKARAHKENKQGNQPDFAKTKEEEEEEEQQSLPE